LRYSLTTTRGITDNWVQLRRDFDPPLDLSGCDHVRFFHRGTAPHTLQVGLTSVEGQNYFARSWNEAAHVPQWTYATWDVHDFRQDGQPFPDLGQVRAIFVSVVGSDEGAGGAGSFAVDELRCLDLASRYVPDRFEAVHVDPAVTRRAADWIAAQQQPGGLLKSWQEESADHAWLYDQALGLIVLAGSGHAAEADRLAGVLHGLQNGDGSWYAGYRYQTAEPITTAQPVGAIAWTVYALARYASLSGSPAAGQDAWEGAAWLASLQRPDNCSLPALPGETTAPTEPNLDAWWAFRATGHDTQAQCLRDFLLEQVWDEGMGRFRSGPGEHQIYLDNQTWGAAFLRAVGRQAGARRALSYARRTLSTLSSDGRVCGLDGAGPFGVWNEGTLQYVAQGGENSQHYWEQMIGQQAADGGMPGSPDAFRGYIVWLTPWHGVAPTAWLYFAGTGGPFLVPRVYLPLVVRQWP